MSFLLRVGNFAPAGRAGAVRFSEIAATGVGHMYNGACYFEVAQCGVAALCRHFPDAAQCRGNQVVQSLANQFSPAFFVAHNRGIEFPPAMTFAANGFVDFGAALFLGVGGCNATQNGKKDEVLKTHDVISLDRNETEVEALILG
ncbi:MAG: hypothetical protein WBV56_09040 [Azonexus sp.]